MLNIAVIGRGVVGLSAAYSLANKGHRLTLVGPENAPGSASVAALGMNVLRGANVPRKPLFAGKVLGHQSLLQRFHELEERTQRKIPISTSGVYEPFRDAPQYEKICRRTFHRPVNEYRAVHAMGGRVIQQKSGLIHALGMPVYGGFYYADDFWFDTRAYLSALQQACIDMGVKVLTQPVQSLSAQKIGKVQLTFLGSCQSPEENLFDEVVVAAGVFADPILQASGVHLPFQSVGGAVLSCTTELPDGVLLSQRRNFVISSGALDFGAEDFDVRVENIHNLSTVYPQALVDKLRALFPEFSSEEQAFQTRLGVRSYFKDRMPVLGTVPFGMHRLWLSLGYHKNGLQLAHICGDALVKLLNDEAVDPVFQAFSPSRF